MDPLQQKLIGELVGLARATDGSEHLISEEVTAVIRACLAAKPATEGELAVCLSRVEQAKRSMVPDCFLCANPCGRTSAYDLARIDRDAPQIREAKYRILKELVHLAESAPGDVPQGRFYRGLIALGLDGYTPEELDSIFN